MQALILAGGEGTRLRPLTTTVPKPVVPLVDRPFIRFMIDWLHGHGVDDVVMSCGHLASGVRSMLGVPISDRGRQIGALLVLARKASRFAADEERFLQSLANMLASTCWPRPVRCRCATAPSTAMVAR